MKKKTLIIGKKNIFSEDSFYIGEWCNNNYCNLPKNLFFKDSINSKKKIVKDSLLYVKYYKELENYLIIKLKKIHKNEYDSRAWKILLGGWLNWYIKIVISRFNILNQCISKNNFTRINFYLRKNLELNSQGTADISLACDNPDWNASVYYKIFLALNKKKKYNIYYKKKFFKKNINYKYSISFKGKFYNFCSKLLSKKNDIFFIGDYFPKMFKMKLFLKILQLPSFWQKIPFAYVDTNFALRNQLKEQIFFKNKKIKSFLFSEVFAFLPNCLLEGFKKNEEISKKVPYPSNPKIIYTAVNFNSDEIFKHWVVQKISSGSKYFTAQHGTSYENNEFHNKHYPEILTSDRFFTWGWNSKMQSFTKKNIFASSFVSKNYTKKEYIPNSYTKDKKILVILPDRFPNRYTWNAHKEFLSVLSSVIFFLTSLKKALITNIMLRLYARNRGDGFDREFENQFKIFKNINKKIIIDKGKTKINFLYKKKSLIVFFYISTGVLEMISLNRPFLGIFTPHDWNLVPKKVFREYYNLYKLGVFHKNSKSASSLLNKIDGNIDKWWLDLNRQKALLDFRLKYARYSKEPNKEFLNFFL